MVVIVVPLATLLIDVAYDRFCGGQEWARDEAKAREAIVEGGGEIEFGKWYSKPTFQEEAVDAMPVVAED